MKLRLHTLRSLTFLSLVTALTLCISCELILGDTEVQLPPLTSTGEDTFGFLFNGEVISVLNSAKISAIYQRGFLQMSGGIQNSKVTKDVKFRVEGPLELNRVYLFNKDSLYRAQFTHNEADVRCRYFYEDLVDGWVSFYHIDRKKYIVSGTFAFTSVTDECDTVRITQGRFDVKYTP